MNNECPRCHQSIELGELYAEVYRRGDHDVDRTTDDGYPIFSVPVRVHVDCPVRNQPAREGPTGSDVYHLMCEAVARVAKDGEPHVFRGNQP